MSTDPEVAVSGGEDGQNQLPTDPAVDVPLPDPVAVEQRVAVADLSTYWKETVQPDFQNLGEKLLKDVTDCLDALRVSNASKAYESLIILLQSFHQLNFWILKFMVQLQTCVYVALDPTYTDQTSACARVSRLNESLHSFQHLLTLCGQISRSKVHRFSDAELEQLTKSLQALQILMGTMFSVIPEPLQVTAYEKKEQNDHAVKQWLSFIETDIIPKIMAITGKYPDGLGGAVHRCDYAEVALEIRNLAEDFQSDERYYRKDGYQALMASFAHAHTFPVDFGIEMPEHSLIPCR